MPKFPMHIFQDLGEWLSITFRERRRWKSSSIQAVGDVRVFYGYESLPTPQDIASGGVVKTQDLQTVFPNTLQGPNLLYLISSALPPYAPRIAQWAQRAGAKVVLNQDGVAYPAWHGVGWETSNRFAREVMEQADYVFYQSLFCKMGADRFLGERNKGFEVLYNPVDTTFFKPSTTTLPSKPVRLLLAGSHHHFYRIQSAVDTLKCLREKGVDVKLDIAGCLCWKADMEKAEDQVREYIQAKSLSADVALFGPYTQEQARLLFHRAHILIHTQYNDNCPRLVVEALASGLPVVYSASGGTQELVCNDAGVGIPAPIDWENEHAPDPAALARAVEQVMRRYESCSRTAREWAVSHFDVKPWLERHREVFSLLVEGHSLDF